MKFYQYSRATRKSQVSFILQSIGSRDTQGWASSFGDGAVEERQKGRGGRKEREREKKAEGEILQDGWPGVERLSTSVLKVCDSLQIDSLSSF